MKIQLFESDIVYHYSEEHLIKIEDFRLNEDLVKRAESIVFIDSKGNHFSLINTKSPAIDDGWVDNLVEVAGCV